MNRYKVVGHLNAGAHGVILKAIHLEQNHHHQNDKNYLAIKKIFIKSQNKKIPLTIIREIKCLQFLRSHQHIIPLEDVFADGPTVNLVFPLLPMNLTTLIYEMNLTDDQCVLYTKMLLEGVYHCHVNGILHRDLKPSNLLIDWNGILKICDFGQARGLEFNCTESNQCQDDNLLSHQVCTRWYRSPELLYGSNHYDYSVDMWSVGCIIGELLQKWPLFKGSSDIEQLCLVVTQLGEPPVWWAEKLPDYNKITFTKDNQKDNLWLDKLRRKCNDPFGADLVSKLCNYTERLNAQQALNHPFVKRHLKADGILFKPQFIKHLVGPPNN